MVKLLCGPVVGLVTASTAHVLVEVDEDTQVVMNLYENTNKHNISEEKVMKGRSPNVFVFNNLRSDAIYEIRIIDITEEPLGMYLFLMC